MSAGDGPATPFLDAEAWLRQRGVPRHELTVAPLPDEPPVVPDAPGPAGDVGEVRVREAVTLAVEAPPEPMPAPTVVTDSLADEVARLVAYARRATANAPMSEGRLRARLADRCDVGIAVEQALERCRRERIVDDRAYAGALIEERRRKGHADLRLRQDLRQRELPDALIDELLAAAPVGDPDAAAFDLARTRAAHLRHLAPEVAFRRLVAFLARRGHPEGLARKVAREVLFVDREAEQIAGH